MKLNVCDVCYYETNVMKDKKVIQSKYRISFKNNMGKRLALDVCEEHRNFFKVCKTFDEAEKKVNKLYGFGV
jgi:hypothetical protein